LKNYSRQPKLRKTNLERRQSMKEKPRLKPILSRKGKRLLLPREEPKEGFTLITSYRNCPLKELESGRLRLLAKSKPYESETGDREFVFYLLTGQCLIETKGRYGNKKYQSIGERNNVFAGLPTAVILPPHTKFSVTCTSRAVDIFTASIPLHKVKGMSAVVRPQDVEIHFIGEGHHRREVRAVLGGEGPSIRLRMGETINPPGGWSSWPRHSFDHHPELAPKFEEVFLYFTKPRNGNVLQRSAGYYPNKEAVDDIWLVKNGNYGVMPLGDHPVVAFPDTTLLYVWVYVSPIPKIYPKWAEDLGEYA